MGNDLFHHEHYVKDITIAFIWNFFLRKKQLEFQIQSGGFVFEKYM